MGISARTLHYYDEIGLFVPTSKTGAGYRLYDDKALETLQQYQMEDARKLMLELAEGYRSNQELREGLDSVYGAGTAFVYGGCDRGIL